MNAQQKYDDLLKRVQKLAHSTVREEGYCEKCDDFTTYVMDHTPLRNLLRDHEIELILKTPTPEY